MSKDKLGLILSPLPVLSVLANENDIIFRHMYLCQLALIGV